MPNRYACSRKAFFIKPIIHNEWSCQTDILLCKPLTILTFQVLWYVKWSCQTFLKHCVRSSNGYSKLSMDKANMKEHIELCIKNRTCWWSSTLVTSVCAAGLYYGRTYSKRLSLIGLTHWGRDKMADVSQTTFSNVFSSMKMCEFRFKFHWSLFLPINNNPALVRIMAWRRPGDKPLSEAMLVSLLTHKCVTRPQWVNTLRPRQ